MPRRSSITPLSASAVFWSGLGWALLLVVLLWSWSQLQAQSAGLPLDTSEITQVWPQASAGVYAVLDAREANRKAYTCVPPPSLKCEGTKLILNEITDHQYTQSHQVLGLAASQTVPVQASQPALPHIVPQPLLRPPALLG